MKGGIAEGGVGAPMRLGKPIDDATLAHVEWGKMERHDASESVHPCGWGRSLPLDDGVGAVPVRHLDAIEPT